MLSPQNRVLAGWSVVLFFLLFSLLTACTPVSPPQEKEGAEVVLLDGPSQTDASREPTPDTRIQEPGQEPPRPDANPDQSKPDLPERHSTPELPEENLSEPAPEPSPEPTPEPVQEIRPEPDTAGPARWIGEPCQQNSDCHYNGGFCLKSGEGFPGGHCSKSCTNTCPDKSGKPVTFCVSNDAGKGICVSQCEKTACRSGYQCLLRSRISDATKLKKVCLPPAKPGRSLTILHIGDSQSSGTRFAKHMVAFLRTPRASCPGAKAINNTVYSYAKVSSAARHWSAGSGSNKTWLCGAKTVYTNGTASANTNGAALCSGITNKSTSIFEKLIAQHKPTAFLIQLGGNSAGFSESYVKGKVKQMMDQLPTGSLCFWVSPSFSSSKYLTKRKAVEKWLKDSLHAYTRIKCSLLTSIDEMSRQTRCTSFNSSDGLHMTSCGSQIWGELISKKLCALGRL